jgi:hypothetical protein
LYDLLSAFVARRAGILLLLKKFATNGTNRHERNIVLKGAWLNLKKNFPSPENQRFSGEGPHRDGGTPHYGSGVL